MADVLDMSKYRVSTLILNNNLDNMGAISRFHWLSHLVTIGYNIETQYFLDAKKKFGIKKHHRKNCFNSVC